MFALHNVYLIDAACVVLGLFFFENVMEIATTDVASLPWVFLEFDVFRFFVVIIVGLQCQGVSVS